jgi:hypothetical protein
MDETGREDIGVILRMKRSAALRKESMMVLAREWGYKGDIWQRSLSSLGEITPVLRPHRGYMDDVAPAGNGGGVLDAATHNAGWQAAQPVPRKQRQRRQQQQYNGGEGRAARAESGAARVTQQPQQQQAGPPMMGVPYGTAQLPIPIDPMASTTAAAVNAAFQAHMEAAQQRQQHQAVLEMVALCDSMRQAGRETAVVWVKVVARVSEQQLAQQREAHRAAGATCSNLCCKAEHDPALAAVADSLSHNAIACAVAHYRREAAAAHGAALAEEAVAVGGGAPRGALNMSAAVVLIRQATELVASHQARLGVVRTAMYAHLATQDLTGVRVAPSAGAQSGAASADGGAASGEVEPSLQWLRCCARLLDDVLKWLAHAETYASAQYGSSSLVCRTLVARLSDAFFSAAEETLTLRRQWLALSYLELRRQRGTDVAIGGSSGGATPEFEAATCVAVVNEVLQTFERTAAAVAAAHAGGADAQA